MTGTTTAGDAAGPGSPGPGTVRPGAPKPVVPARRAGGLLAGRYAITAVVRQGTGGGVFTGRDLHGGGEVLVKQARTPVGADRAGPDGRTALRHEAALLARLAGLGLAPHPVGLVEQDGSLFLVQERITGQPLDGWVAERLRGDGTPGVDWADAGPLARALVELLARVHATGLVLRGLSPANVLVLPDGGPRLAGLEFAAPAATAPSGPVGTLNACGPYGALGAYGVLGAPGAVGGAGYRAPEQAPAGRLTLVGAGPGHAHRPDPAAPAADLYALGGLFFLLATGHDPLLPEDLPRARPVPGRLRRWLDLAAREGVTARRLAPPALGLRADEPGERWSLARVRAALTDGGTTDGTDGRADGGTDTALPLPLPPHPEPETSVR